MLRAVLVLYGVLLTASLFSQTVNRAEYYFNTDPGTGNATAVPVSAASSLDVSFNVVASGLSTGFHTFNFRVRTSDNKWSHTMSRSFYIITNPVLAPAAQVKSLEYFLDNDPGAGNGINVPVTSSAEINPTILHDVTALAPGFHTINVRVMDNLGRWSHFMQRTFYRFDIASFVASTNVQKAEYFIDSDPGIGQGTPLTIPASPSQDNTFNIDLNGKSLTEGFHQLNVRYQDNLGRWSHAPQRSFYIIPSNALPAANIVEVQYFIDANPDVTPDVSPSGKLPITPTPSIDNNYVIDMTGIASGGHTLYIRAKDDNGFYSNVMNGAFTVTACIPPSPPVAADQIRCSEGTVTLNATGATGTQTYRWYDDPVAGSPLGTNAAFTTPELSSTTSYYVSVYDNTTLCESSREEVEAVIRILPRPVINSGGEIAFCEGNSVFLSAPQGASEYQWSNGQTTQQILVTEAGSYSVQTGDGVCLSAPSQQVVVTLIARPSKPVINVQGEPVVCGGGSVQLSAPDGFSYVWSNGSTQQNITVMQTGVFILFVKDANNCFSAASDPVAITFLTPPCGGGTVNNPPKIDATPLAAQIEGNVIVDLTTLVSDPDNNIDYASLTVVDGVTSRGVPASIDEDYRLVISYAGNPFSGTDRVTVQACDLVSACTQEVIDIDVVGDILVYNGITPNGDGHNDFLLIKYIDAIEGASQNNVRIINRWGDVVFEVTDYNNEDRVFAGLSKNGNELPSGTYFYIIEYRSGRKAETGYLTLLR
jgi:gliding motility-associated-like protein